MLKRLGRVLWWFGTVLLFLAALLLVNAARLTYQAGTVRSLKAELSDVQAKESALQAPYLAKSSQGGADVFMALDPVGTLKDRGAPLAVQKGETALEAREQALSNKIGTLQGARSEAERSGVLMLALGIAGVLLWSLAYVLGGSFLRPPTA